MLVDKFGKSVTSSSNVQPLDAMVEATVQFAPRMSAMVDDIKMAKLMVLPLANQFDRRRDAWPEMLQLMDDATLIYCGHADRKAVGTMRTNALTFLTMEVAALVHGKGSNREVDTGMSDKMAQRVANAVGYVQFCCIAEILRRNGMLKTFSPYWDVLNWEQVTEADIQISDEGVEYAKSMLRKQQEDDLQGIGVIYGSSGEGGENAPITPTQPD